MRPVIKMDSEHCGLCAPVVNLYSLTAEKLPTDPLHLYKYRYGCSNTHTGVRYDSKKEQAQQTDLQMYVTTQAYKTAVPNIYM